MSKMSDEEHNLEDKELEQEPMGEEPDNPEDILEAQLSRARGTHDEPEFEEVSKKLFQLRCGKYKSAKVLIALSNDKLEGETKHITEQIRELQEKKNQIYEDVFKNEQEVLNAENTRLKDKIIETFPDEKTVKFEGIGRFTKKILKSIEVVDKDKLLAALVEKKMLSKGVKTFDITFLKKSKELDLFSDDEVKAIEKPSLLFVEEKPKENQKL